VGTVCQKQSAINPKHWRRSNGIVLLLSKAAGKNQTDWIKTGGVHISRTELSVKEIKLKGLALYNLRKYNEAMNYRVCCPCKTIL
jgi:hypothetical protein